MHRIVVPSAYQDDIWDPQLERALTWLGPFNGHPPLLYGYCTLLTNESGGPIKEFSLLSSVEHVLSLSEKDRQLAQTLYALPSVAVNDFVPPDWQARVRRDQAERNWLLFFANFERPEKLDAARWLVLEVLPAIQLALPGVNVTLVGNACDRLAKELDSASVQSTGYVEDPSPYFSRCRLTISSADGRCRCQVQDT